MSNTTEVPAAIVTAQPTHPTYTNHVVTGKFALGNKASAGKGRPKKEQETAVLVAINQVAPPERIAHAIDQMFLLAEQHGSWKAYDAAVTLALNYQLGRPTARVEQSGDTFANLVATLLGENRE